MIHPTKENDSKAEPEVSFVWGRGPQVKIRRVEVRTESNKEEGSPPLLPPLAPNPPASDKIECN
jgi:hypothetical protein